MKNPAFVHRFIPGDQSSPALLLLHGTGGTEHDLVPIGQQLLPGASILSLRGRVLENGMPRFFRRLREGVFDQEDLRLQTDTLAAFLDAARHQYRFEQLVAVGYSNGANMAASLMFTHPNSLSGAVLFRPMVPFRPDPVPDLSNSSVLISSGKRDPIVPVADASELANIFKSAGARVSTHWYEGGHELSRSDLQTARLWIAQTVETAPQAK